MTIKSSQIYQRGFTRGIDVIGDNKREIGQEILSFFDAEQCTNHSARNTVLRTLPDGLFHADASYDTQYKTASTTVRGIVPNNKVRNIDQQIS